MLQCVSPVKNSRGAWTVGDVVDDAALEAHLLADSKESWQHVKLKKPFTPEYVPIDAPEPTPEG